MSQQNDSKPICSESADDQTHDTQSTSSPRIAEEQPKLAASPVQADQAKEEAVGEQLEKKDATSEGKEAEVPDSDPTDILLDQIIQSVQQGEPTQMVRALLQELSAHVTGDFRGSLKGEPTGPLTGIELTNQVLANPQILWQKYFFDQLRRLDDNQKEVVLDWFYQMTSLQEVYISEIEKANNYLKMLVCQGYERLHTSERFKQEFIAKINHIENRVYFQKKRKNLSSQFDDVYGAATPSTTLDSSCFTMTSGAPSKVVPPAPVMVQFDGKRGGRKDFHHNHHNHHHHHGARFQRDRDEQVKREESAPDTQREPPVEQREETENRGVTGIAPKTDQMISQFAFYDNISTSCATFKNSPSKKGGHWHQQGRGQQYQRRSKQNNRVNVTAPSGFYGGDRSYQHQSYYEHRQYPGYPPQARAAQGKAKSFYQHSRQYDVASYYRHDAHDNINASTWTSKVPRRSQRVNVPYFTLNNSSAKQSQTYPTQTSLV